VHLRPLEIARPGVYNPPMGEGGKIPLASGLGRPLYSRPLRTGATFTLVVSSTQVNYVHWNRNDYAPGDSCVLTIKGKNLGTEAVEVVIEEEQEGGALAAQIRVEGMEGEKLTVVVEREMPDTGAGAPWPPRRARCRRRV